MAVPATAFGQSAGDDQYVDPFQDDAGDRRATAATGNQGNADAGRPSRPSAQAPADTGATASTTAPTSAAAATRSAHRPPDRGRLALIGVILLLGGGFTLRRAWPLPRRRPRPANGDGSVTRRDAPVVIDARAAARREIGGVERVTIEMATRLPRLRPDRYAVMRPPSAFAYRAGHLWEQALLPAAARRRG